MTALRKEQDERYASAGALAADIERHFNGRTVSAHTDTSLYRVRKFVLRNKLVVVATALIFAALMAGLAATLWQNGVARQQAERARREAAVAVETRDFLADMLRLGDPDRRQAFRDTGLVKQFVRAGLSRIDQLQTPSTRALVLDLMGNIYLQYNLWDEASALYSESLALKRDELGDRHPDLAETLKGLANIGYNAQDHDEAESAYRWALETLHDEPEKHHLIRSEIRRDLGNLLVRAGRFEEARDLFEANLSSELDSMQFVESLEGVALVDREMEQFSASESRFLEVLAIKYALYDSLHQEIANTKMLLGGLLYLSGKTEGAIANTRDAKRIYEYNFGPNHIAVGHASVQLGRIHLKNRQDNESAIRAYEEALSSYTNSLGQDHELVKKTIASIEKLRETKRQ